VLISQTLLSRRGLLQEEAFPMLEEGDGVTEMKQILKRMNAQFKPL
jgi:hypothetical protein